MFVMSGNMGGLRLILILFFDWHLDYLMSSDFGGKTSSEYAWTLKVSHDLLWLVESHRNAVRWKVEIGNGSELIKRHLES